MAATRTIPHFTVLPSEFFASPFCPFSLNSMVDPTTNWVGLTVLPSFERQMYSFDVVSITRSYCWCFCFLSVLPTVFRSFKVAVWIRLAAEQLRKTARRPERGRIFYGTSSLHLLPNQAPTSLAPNASSKEPRIMR